mmetsp:Transcript_12283/g.27074  ORF Transcript_12283/g.27074 Transcript_12283/m.27074 type:complete len:260 (+) Transcript_12283:641-1420(+)
MDLVVPLSVHSVMELRWKHALLAVQDGVLEKFQTRGHFLTGDTLVVQAQQWQDERQPIARGCPPIVALAATSHVAIEDLDHVGGPLGSSSSHALLVEQINLVDAAGAAASQNFDAAPDAALVGSQVGYLLGVLVDGFGADHDQCIRTLGVDVQGVYGQTLNTTMFLGNGEDVQPNIGLIGRPLVLSNDLAHAHLHVLPLEVAWSLRGPREPLVRQKDDLQAGVSHRLELGVIVNEEEAMGVSVSFVQLPQFPLAEFHKV